MSYFPKDLTPTNGSFNTVESNGVFDELALKAPLASPTFTGNVNVPATSYGVTASTTDTSTLLATTGLVNNKLVAHVSLTDPHGQYVLESTVGQANGVAGLDSTGKVPVGQLPALAITNTFVVATQEAMLALTAEVGDIAIRTDTNETYILQVDGAATLVNWQKILTPTDALTNVGSVGTWRSVTIDIKGRVTAGTNPTTIAGYGLTDAANISHAHGNITSAGAIGTTTTLPIITGASGVLQAGAWGTTAGTFAQGDALALKAPLASPTFTGTVSGITAAMVGLGNVTNNAQVTSVSALTLGTTGTDVTSTVATGTTTPVITLNIPTASAANRGALSAADWSTFNGKAPIASPTFTGTPAAPTATVGTNTTQLATTAFVTAAIGAQTSSAEIEAVTAVPMATGTTAATASHRVVVFTTGTGATQIYTLPAASQGRRLVIKNRGAAGSAVTINRNGTDTIDGGAGPVVAYQNQAFTFVCNGTDWMII